MQDKTSDQKLTLELLDIETLERVVGGVRKATGGQVAEDQRPFKLAACSAGARVATVLFGSC